MAAKSHFRHHSEALGFPNSGGDVQVLAWHTTGIRHLSTSPIQGILFDGK